MLNPNAPLIKLTPIPDRIYDIHMWADYIELLCLVNSDRRISKADALDRVRERAADLGEIHDDREDPSDDSIDDDLSAPVNNDKWSARIGQWFEHLKYRGRAFNETYPFQFSPRGDAIEAKDSLTSENKLYIFLLLASNLRFIMPAKPILTNDFEYLSYEALKDSLPGHAEVHMFGSNPRNQGRYTGQIWEKIINLAKDINEEVCITSTLLTKF